jgi:hypothetical protein
MPYDYLPKRSGVHPGCHVIGWHNLPENVELGWRIVGTGMSPGGPVIHARKEGPLDWECSYLVDPDFVAIARLIAEAEGREPSALEPSFVDLAALDHQGMTHVCLMRDGADWFWGIGAATAEGAAPVVYGWEATETDAWLALRRACRMPSGKTETNADGTVRAVPIGAWCQHHDRKGNNSWFGRQLLDGIHGRRRKKTKSTGRVYGPIYTHSYSDEGEWREYWTEQRVTRVTAKSVFLQKDAGCVGLMSEIRLDREKLEREGRCHHRDSYHSYFTADGRAAFEAERRKGSADAGDRALLGLDDGELTARGIMGAFRRRVREIHSDLGGSGDGAAMTALIEARERLLAVVAREAAAAAAGSGKAA